MSSPLKAQQPYSIPPVMGAASTKAWEALHALSQRAIRGAGDKQHLPTIATGNVPGIGFVGCAYIKQWVERSNGPKIRKRFVWALGSERISEKALYERVRALTD